MATQFEKIMGRLDDIATKLDFIAQRLEIISPPGSLNLDSEVGDTDTPFRPVVEGGDPIPKATRTHAPVRTTKGTTEMVSWNEIDPRAIEAARLSAEQGEPWEFYFGDDGSIRISVSESIAHQVRKSRTYQQPVPRVGDRDIDALGTDEP